MPERLNKEFGACFKRMRLTAGIATLHELTLLLAEHDFVFEDSFLSHMQAGRRVPKKRPLFLAVLRIFKAHNAAFTVDQCNEFLHTAGQGYLTENEERELGFLAHQAVFPAPGKELSVQAVWYQRIAQDYIIIFRRYITDDTSFYAKLDDSYELILDLLAACIEHGFVAEVLGLWEIVKKYQWEKADWDAYERLAEQIGRLLKQRQFPRKLLRIQVEDIVGMYLCKREFERAASLLARINVLTKTDDPLIAGIYFRQVGIVEFSRGQYPQSLAALETSLGYLKQVNVPGELCRTALDIGILHEKLGALPRAKRWYGDYLPVARQRNLPELESAFNFHLWEVCTELSGSQKARHYLTRSEEIEEQLKAKAGAKWRERFHKTKVQVCIDSYFTHG